MTGVRTALAGCGLVGGEQGSQPGRLRPDELASPISAFEVPPPLRESVEVAAAPAPIA